MQKRQDTYDRLPQYLGLIQSVLSRREPYGKQESIELESDTILSESESDDSNSDEPDEQSPRQNIFSIDTVLRTRQLVFDANGEWHIPRLRDPLDLFTIPSTSCPFQGVRWPIECEVIPDRIQHIEWEPPEPESFYEPTGEEDAPVPAEPEEGNTVYCLDSVKKTSYFTFSRMGGSRGVIKNATLCANNQNNPVLSFESRFESGNLQKAVQVAQHEYELTLRTDMYTAKHTQWFYFRVRNMRAGTTYRFTITNLMKASSLYSTGMRPLLYSEQASLIKGQGWYRSGANIRYFRNNPEQEGSPLFSLTWTLEFPFDDDTCYLAHCYPYTYSDLQGYLREVSSDPVRSAHCKLRVLCRSLAGNSVYVLTVTTPSACPAEHKAKRAVVVTARVHPGETNGSWMMQGFLEFLLSDLPDARLLRETFVFKVIPMLNPDGVVVGNYRCSLAGRDLNRNYRSQLRDSFPCTWYTRNMVKRLLEEREVVVYCDFHGHSRKNNVFMYGCNSRKDAKQCLEERVFPLMMSKNAKEMFSFRSCKFKIQRSKEGTGRIVMWRLGIQNSYTMESTFGGSTLGFRKGTHFSTRDLKSMGYSFGDTLLDYCDPDPSKSVYCLEELGMLLKQEVRRKLGRDLDSLKGLSDIDLESSTSGSNSTESDGLPVHLLNNTKQEMQGKKKHMRSRKERDRLRQERVQNPCVEPAIIQTEDKKMDPIPLNENAAPVKIQEKPKCSNKVKKKSKEPIVVKPNKSSRSLIPHPTAHIVALDNDLPSSSSNSSSDPRPLSALHGYQDATFSSCQKRLRQTLLASAGQKRLLPVSAPRPLQEYTIPPFSDLRAPPVKGASYFLNSLQKRHQQEKLNQERPAQTTPIRILNLMPIDNMGSLTISNKADAHVSAASRDSVLPGTVKPSDKNCGISLPELQSPTQQSGNQAIGSMRLGKLLDKSGRRTTVSPDNLSSEEKVASRHRTSKERTKR